jgi:hypothetical protein
MGEPKDATRQKRRRRHPFGYTKVARNKPPVFTHSSPQAAGMGSKLAFLLFFFAVLLIFAGAVRG